MSLKLSMKAAETVFLDVWYQTSPVTYNELWYPGVQGTKLIDDLVKAYPKTYRNVMKEMEARGYDF